MNNQRLCFAVDLENDPEIIRRYQHLHRPGGPPAGVTRAIRAAGIAELDIYLIGNRLFMILEPAPDFSPQRKDEADAREPDAQAWNSLMESMQRALPFVANLPGLGKWRGLEHIYSLTAQP